MFKKIAVLFFPIILFSLFLFPVYKTLGATTTTPQTQAVDTAGEPNPDVPTSYVGSQQINDIKNIIGKNTPDWIAQPIIWIVNTLENFRQNGFNNVFIFYGLFFILLYIILRSIWRFFF